MQNDFKGIIAIMLSVTLLAACSSATRNADSYQTNAEQHRATCDALKRQIIYLERGTTQMTQSYGNSEADAVRETYNEKNC